MKRFLFILLIVVFASVFLYSACSIGLYFLDAKEQQDKYDDLAAMVDKIKEQQKSGSAGMPAVPGNSGDPAISDPGENGTDEPQAPSILPEYAELYALNSDLVGWIRIDDTKINYPVMQTPGEKDYYLRRNFDGESNTHGCLFVREVCDVNAPSDNLTIYGHRMRDGTMFADLDKFQKKSFWEEHRYFTFDTLTQHNTYEIVAVFKTTASLGKGFAYHLFVDAADQAEFDEFISTCKSLALYETGVTAAYGDKLVTLSTCDYYTENGRLVVVAKRVEEGAL